MSRVKCAEVSIQPWLETMSPDCSLSIAKNVDPRDRLLPSVLVITPKLEQTEEHRVSRLEEVNLENCFTLVARVSKNSSCS
jgi:hypothetical protein